MNTKVSGRLLTTRIFQRSLIFCQHKAMEGTHSASQHSSMRAQETDDSGSHGDIQQSLGSPIGFIRSCFKSKNGTPRQPSVCTFSRAKLRVLKEVFPNPEHSIQGLGEFSHIWILFVFHKNGGRRFTKAKVKPPRLDGAKVGVFATRSPHRPNPIGLTLAKLDRIQGDTLHLSGVDIIDGTPVLDIKPYVPSYDNPDRICSKKTPSTDLRPGSEPITGKLTGSASGISNSGTVKECNADVPVLSKEAGTTSEIESISEKISDTCNNSAANLRSKSQGQIADSTGSATDLPLANENDIGYSYGSKVGVADWIHCPPINMLEVRFTAHAEAELQEFKKESADSNYQLEFLQDQQEARQAICEILKADPRSTYRRNSCQDRLYFFTVDTLHITCWFGRDFVEVVRIQPVSCADIPQST